MTKNDLDKLNKIAELIDVASEETHTSNAEEEELLDKLDAAMFAINDYVEKVENGELKLED